MLTCFQLRIHRIDIRIAAIKSALPTTALPPSSGRLSKSLSPLATFIEAANGNLPSNPSYGFLGGTCMSKSTDTVLGRHHACVFVLLGKVMCSGAVHSFIVKIILC